MNDDNSKRSDRAGEIARAALELFTHKGFQATSVEQIAAAAGIGKSTVYEYFKTKENLFIAAVQEASDQWVEELKDIARQTPDAVDRLYRVADLCMEFSEPQRAGENRLFFEVLMQTVMDGGVYFSKRHLIREIHQRMVRIIVDYLLTGVSDGQLDPGIARHAKRIAINFLAYLDGIQLYGMIGKEYIDSREQVQFFMRYLIPILTCEKTEADGPNIPTNTFQPGA